LAKDEGSIDEEIVRKLVELRTYLDNRIKELEDEQDKLRTLFKILEEVLVSKSFRRAEAAQPARLGPIEEAAPPSAPPVAPQPPKTTVPPGEEIPLKTQGGLLLANMYVTETEAHIVPAHGMVFNVSTPPFQSFLVGRILEPMRRKDEEDVRSSALTPDQALEYEVVKEGDVIREIVVRNYGNQRRMREIMTTTRWTLEKMSEKVGTPP